MDPETMDLTFGTKATNALFAIAGGLVTHLWSKYRERRIILSWTANFQRLMPEASDPISSKIQVLVHSRLNQNLYSCQITILNESSRDVDELEILFTFQNSYFVLHDQGSISTSAKTLFRSRDYQNTVQEILKLPEPDRQKHISWDYVNTNREFHLPSLNRGSSATFTFLIDSNVPNQVASVIVTSEKKGVKLLSRPAQPHIFGVPLKLATPWGILIAVILVFIVSRFGLSSTKLAFLCFLLGTASLLFGIGLIRMFRLLRTMFG
jgi:hypothetical protein